MLLLLRRSNKVECIVEIDRILKHRICNLLPKSLENIENYYIFGYAIWMLTAPVSERSARLKVASETVTKPKSGLARTMTAIIA